MSRAAPGYIAVHGELPAGNAPALERGCGAQMPVLAVGASRDACYVDCASVLGNPDRMRAGHWQVRSVL